MRLKMTREEFMTTHEGPSGHLPTEMTLCEEGIPASIASAMREAGISNCSQFKSAFSSGNGGQSPRAKGSYDASYDELLKDARVMRAAAEAARGTKFFPKYDAAAKWLEAYLEGGESDFIKSIARMRGVDLI